MKKVLFSIQVFALVAMFPVCMMLELNREKAKSPAHRSNIEMKYENGCMHDAVIDSANPFGFLMLKSCGGTRIDTACKQKNSLISFQSI